jgi:hypothetical protein
VTIFIGRPSPAWRGYQDLIQVKRWPAMIEKTGRGRQMREGVPLFEPMGRGYDGTVVDAIKGPRDRSTGFGPLRPLVFEVTKPPFL